MKLPHFKYHPNVYELDLFEEEQGECSICLQGRSLRYEGPFYSIEDPEYICPWCIADGSAAEKYNGEFNDYCGIEGVSPNPNDPEPTIQSELLDEICLKTPGYHSWQQGEWQSHCNEPCVFLGYADTDSIQPFYDEIKEELIESGQNYSLEMLNNISKDGHVVGYLFQCAQCGKHKLHIDCD